MSAGGRALLSLGSNLEPVEHLRAAVAALRARFAHVAVSRAYRFPAVGFEGPDFVNAAAALDSDLPPEALNEWLHALEARHGRVRGGPRFASRTLDIDIVYFDQRVLDGPGTLQVPRDEVRHAFVLKPLAEIAPAFVDPRRGCTLEALWRAHPEHDAGFDAVAL